MQFVVVVQAIDRLPTLFVADLCQQPLVNTAVTLGDDGEIMAFVEATSPLGAAEIVMSLGWRSRHIATVEVPADSGFFAPPITEALGRIHLVPDTRPSHTDDPRVPNKPSGKRRNTNSSINRPSTKKKRGFDPLAIDY